MDRRLFIRNTLLALPGLATHPTRGAWWQSWQDVIIGHGTHRYKVDLNWGALNAHFYPVQDCHEMVQDSRGRILLLTNHTRNNIIIYDKKGKLLNVWGTEFPGAHGLTLNNEGGEDFLYIADNARHEVIKTTLDGRIIQVISYPRESGKYQSPGEYIPTETAIAPNGDIYVADGYGLQYIHQYNSRGELLHVFGGPGDGPAQFRNAHGICLDYRDPKHPTLLITERQHNQLKRFSLDGEHLSTIELPGAFICRPVIHGQQVYLATIWSGSGAPGTGFVSILDENDRLISAPGGCTPVYQGNQLQPMYQALQLFQHPHDVCVDDEENLYIAQWNAGQTYPIKLYRV